VVKDKFVQKNCQYKLVTTFEVFIILWYSYMERLAFTTSRIFKHFITLLHSMSGRLCWWFSFSFDVLLLRFCTRMERSANPRGLWYDFIAHLSQHLRNHIAICFDLIYFSFTMTFCLFFCWIKIVLIRLCQKWMQNALLFLNHFAEEPEKTNISPPTAQYMES